MSDGPDFAQALIGYRAWRVDSHARLCAHTLGEPWPTGVNRAQCRYHRFAGGRARRHRAPNPGCMCGIYALRDPFDRQFAVGDALGAIAAWGDVQVHPTGFRAEYACILALTKPRGTGQRIGALIEEAAERYDVPLVEHHELEAEALRYGAPLEWKTVADVPEHPDPDLERPAWRRGLGRDVEQHTWARVDRGEVVVGLGYGLLRELDDAAELMAPRRGHALARGGELGAIVTAAGPLVLSAPVSGLVTAVNEDVLAGRALRPEADSWLVRLEADRWDAEAPALAWGRPGDLLYASVLAQGGDVLAELRPERRRARPPIGSFGDVRRALLAARRTQRFEDAEAFTRAVVEPLRERLARDARLAGHLARADTTIALRVRDPDAAVALELRPPRARVVLEPPSAEPDVALELGAELAADWLSGRVDLPLAIRRGDAKLTGSRGRLGIALSLLVELTQPSRTWGHRRSLAPLPGRPGRR